MQDEVSFEYSSELKKFEQIVPEITEVKKSGSRNYQIVKIIAIMTEGKENNLIFSVITFLYSFRTDKKIAIGTIRKKEGESPAGGTIISVFIFE